MNMYLLNAHCILSGLTNCAATGRILGDCGVYHIEGSDRVTEERSGNVTQPSKLTLYGLAMVGGAGLT